MTPSTAVAAIRLGGTDQRRVLGIFDLPRVVARLSCFALIEKRIARGSAGPDICCRVAPLGSANPAVARPRDRTDASLGFQHRPTYARRWEHREGDTVAQRTLVLIKPDAVRRGIVGRVLDRFEAKGLSIVAMEMRLMDGALADAHYADHLDKPFYPPLKTFMTGGPLVAMVLEGDEAIEVVRALVGATDGRKALAGTIRGDMSLSNRENLVHASDSEASAKREIGLWFPHVGA
jgi:nucleoside-diphosphate kinase